MPGREVNIHITSGSIVKTLLFIILFGVLWYLREIVLIVLTAIVIASAIEPGINSLMRHLRISRFIAILSIYFSIAVIFFLVLFVFIPPVLDDAVSFLRQLPVALMSVNLSDVTHGMLPQSSFDAWSSANILQSLSHTLTETTGGAFATLSAFFGGITSFVLIVVFSIYFSIQETGVDDFLRIVTPAQNQAYVLNLWKRSQDKIGKWMQGQLILGCIVGILLYLGLTIFGVKYALLLAIIAAIFELIPVFGQIISAVPGVAIAFSTGGPRLAIITLILYFVVQQFEAHLIYPVVVKKVVGVPPILVILALLVGFRLFGFLGVLLSVPIAGAIQELVADIDKRKSRAVLRGDIDQEPLQQ